MPTPFNDQWRLPRWEDSDRPHGSGCATAAGHTAALDRHPVQGLRDDKFTDTRRRTMLGYGTFEARRQLP